MNGVPRLADLHCHLVPGVDDGAETLEDALGWLEAYEQDGITRVATTPHLPARLADSDYRRRVESRFAELERAAADRGIGVELSLAYEIRMDGAPLDPEDEGLWLGPGGHVLVEFQGLTFPAEPDRELSAVREAGLMPVLAHPERYAGIGKAEAWLSRWRERGVVLCVNAGSLWGGYGPEPMRVARGMLARGEADVIGSDHHARPHRSDSVREARALLSAGGHAEAADRLVSENPLALLAGEEPLPVPPARLEQEEAGRSRRRWWEGILGAGGT